MSKHDAKYLQMALLWSQASYAERLKVGAIIVKDNQIVSDGYNGMPEGFENICEYVDQGQTLSRPEVLHAEANAIMKLARSTMSSVGATLFCSHSPCFECAKLIIQAKIKRVVYRFEYRNSDGLELLKKANIETLQLEL